MPTMQSFACDSCRFSVRLGWGRQVYAIDGKGRRVICMHPGEAGAVMSITGMDFFDALEARRAGHINHCLCLGCLKRVELDDRDFVGDKGSCPKCGSDQVRTSGELYGHPCPKCAQGKLRSISSGMMC